MEVRALADADPTPVVAAVARWQQQPDAHVCFVGVDDATVAAEFADVERWRERTVVARRADRVVGVVLADVDEERGRLWWFGPWGDDDDARRAVLEAASAVLPAGVTRFEFGPDQRNTAVAALAAARGAVAGTPSSVLSLDPLVAPVPRVVVGVGIEELGDGHREAVARHHDELFPGTHTTGAALVAGGDRRVLVAVEGGEALGYVATEVHADGSLYVDYLGTTPAARRRGIATALIGEALRRGADDGWARAHLTVRHDADGARALYRALGFVEERVIAPWVRVLERD